MSNIVRVVRRCRGAWLFPLSVLVFGVSAGMGGGKADLAVAEYQSRMGHLFEYRLSEDGDRVVRVSGVLSDPIDGDRVEGARRFFSGNTEMFGVDPQDVERAESRVLTSRNGVHVALTQTVGGIPVMGPASYVHYDAMGRVSLVQNNFLNGRHAETIPKLGLERIVARAKQACSQDGGEVATGTPRLVQRREGDDLRLVYCVPAHVASKPPMYWLVFVDASDPCVVPQRLNQVFNATATGTIYGENPYVSPLESLVFRDLKSSKSLSGLHVKTYNANRTLFLPVTSVDLSKYTTASETDGDYTYPPTDSSWGDARFAEAMVYYHMDRAHDVLKGMGFNELDLQFPVFANLSSEMGADNAFYVPGAATQGLFPKTGFIAILPPAAFNNFAFDADILCHEYGHAVLDHIQPNMGAAEHWYGWAYHEGWGDILTAGLSGNPTGAEYALVWRQTGLWLGRNCDNNHKYPDDVRLPGPGGLTEPHYAGEIVSGVFWDLYKEIGERALQAFLDGNYFLDGTETFFGIRDAVVQAGEERDKKLITRAFAAHGISGPDRGNPAKVEILDVYIGGMGTWDVVKRTTFKRGEGIGVFVDARVEGAAPGYSFYGKLTVSDPDAISVHPQGDQRWIEATNGTRSRSPKYQPPYMLYQGEMPAVEAGKKYTFTLEGHLGGTKLSFTKTMEITIVE